MPSSARKHRFEFAVLRALGGVLSRSPYWLALLIGFVLALFGHYVLRYRAAAARDRIRQVFPSYSPARVRRIAWLAWRNFIFNVIDTTMQQTPNSMSWLDKSFGRDITSRTWKTVLRIRAAMDRA